MDDKDFLNWEQKQRDYEDVKKQHQRSEKKALAEGMLTWARKDAKKDNVTLEVYIARLEAHPDTQIIAVEIMKYLEWVK